MTKKDNKKADNKKAKKESEKQTELSQDEIDHLRELENKSIYIIREAYKKFNKLGMLWSIGKDSTTMLWLVKKAFFGKVPFPLIYIDTGKHFQKMYDFRDECVKKWNLDLIISQNEEADKQDIGPKDKLKCCGMRKTQALKDTIAEHQFEALFLGIRRDEHGIRAKERTFSPRNKDFKWDYKNQAPELWDQYKSQKETEQHLRVHPILHWTEVDIWKYTKLEGLPVNPLYFADEDGKRYRSLGCQPCTDSVESKASNLDEIIKEVEESDVSERSGRAQDKEEANAMQKLRALGYMVWFMLFLFPIQIFF